MAVQKKVQNHEITIRLSSLIQSLSDEILYSLNWSYGKDKETN